MIQFLAMVVPRMNEVGIRLADKQVTPKLPPLVASLPSFGFLSGACQTWRVISVLMDMRRSNQARAAKDRMTMKHCVICYSPSRRELGDICPECNWEEDMVETENTSWVSDGQRFSMTIGYSSCNGWTWMEFQQWYVNSLRGSRLRMFRARCKRLGLEVVKRTSDEDQRFF